MRRLVDSKPHTCTERLEVDAAGISGKVSRLTLGDLSICPVRRGSCATGVERYRDASAEVSRGHSSPLDPDEGPNTLKQAGA